MRILNFDIGSFLIFCSLNWRRLVSIGANDAAAQKTADIAKENRDGHPALSNNTVIATAKRGRSKSFAGAKDHRGDLVLRFRSSHHIAAASFANFGIEEH
jgi:hypothetical protein